MTRIILAVLAIVIGGAQAAAIEETYPGFQNLGSFEVSSAGAGVGIAATSRKTLYLSVEEADWHDAYLHCKRTILGGELLAIETVDEGERVLEHLVQHQLRSCMFWTGGIRDGAAWRWLASPSNFIPASFWGPDEPNTNYSYDVVMFVMKNLDSYNLQAYPSLGMFNHRYVCQKIASD